MPKAIEIAARRDLASGTLNPKQISEKHGIHLKRVQAWVKDAEKDLAAARLIRAAVRAREKRE